MTLLKAIPILSVILISCCTSAFSERVRTSFSQQEVKQVKESATNSIEELMRHLNTLATPSIVSSEIDYSVGQHFSGKAKIFLSDKFEIDDDLDPDNTEPGRVQKNIRQYLIQFHDNYFPLEEDGITATITSISDIYIGEKYNFVRVYYTQNYKGKAGAGGKDLPRKRLMVAEMQIAGSDESFTALINDIYFANRPVNTDKERKAAITADKTDIIAKTATQTSAYYENALRTGMRLSADNNYTDAYYALNEAMGGQESIKAQAGSELEKMSGRMRTANYDINDYLAKELMARGRKLSKKSRYEEAKKYLGYALELAPDKSGEIGSLLRPIDEKISAQRPLQALLDKGAYAEARTSYERALQHDEHNPNLLIGLGRANAALGNFKASDYYFTSAITEDATRPETYLWESKMLLQNRNYEKAYDALVKYKYYAAEAAGPDLDANLAYVKGMTLYAHRNFKEALDSFQRAATPEAQLAAADIYLQQRDYASVEKITDRLLRSDNKNAAAHYMLGQLYTATATAGNAEHNRKAALEQYRTAASLDNTNYRYYSGIAHLELDSKMYEEAVQDYNACIEKSGHALKPAYWQRGICYLHLGRYNDAYNDFKMYADSSGMTPPPDFYVDYGRVLLRMSRYAEAEKYLRLAGENQEAFLMMGVSNYLQNPATKNVYMNWFERALIKGVSKESVGDDPDIRKLYSTDKDFKSLIKKYGYGSVM